MKNIIIPELLSPAGSIEHFKAAVQNGADGVYFGGQQFNARQGAVNFSDEEIIEAVAYAHLRDVKAYMALNTLTRDDELIDVISYVEKAIEAGVDAFIVQDIGVASVFKQYFPTVRIHLSTQGTIYNKEGARFAKNSGFKRVVLARELSKAEIKEIVDSVDIETEIFVHGALCVSYSGQCVMSSMIGSRSGNRGTCAQPCRLPYQLETLSGRQISSETYLLSPKDLCLLENLDELAGLGVTSLKIEGRLKSPEYTGLITSVYRKYLDKIRDEGKAGEIAAEDLRNVTQMFNRGSFTTGYFDGKKGFDLLSGARAKHRGILLGEIKGSRASAVSKEKSLVEIILQENLEVGDGIEIEGEGLPGGVVTFIKGKNGLQKEAEAGETVWVGDIPGKIETGDPVFKVTDKSLMKQIRESYDGKEHKKIEITGKFTARFQNPVSFEIYDKEGNTGRSKSQITPEKALSVALTKEKALINLEKTGDTPFKLVDCQVSIDEGISVSAADINKLRREALEELIKNKSEKIKCSMELPEQIITQAFKDVNSVNSDRMKPLITLYFYKWNRKYQEVGSEAGRIYLPYDEFIEGDHLKRDIIEDMTDLHGRGVQIVATFPTIDKGEHAKNMQSFLKLIGSDKMDFLEGISVANPGQLELLTDYKGKIYADYSFNVYNSLTVKALKDIGISGAVTSYEMSFDSAYDIDNCGIELEHIIYGRIPVMISEYCPLAGAEKIEGEHCGKCLKEESFLLKDRADAKYPVILDSNACRSMILSMEPINRTHIFREKNRPVTSNYRICIFDESAEQIMDLIEKLW